MNAHAARIFDNLVTTVFPFQPPSLNIRYARALFRYFTLFSGRWDFMEFRCCNKMLIYCRRNKSRNGTKTQFDFLLLQNVAFH